MGYLENNFRTLKKQIYSNMLDARKNKYKWFLRCLRSFKYLSLNPTRGNFLEAYYVLMRLIDDVVDGDMALPDNFSSKVEFMEDKINFSKNQYSPRDRIDYLMLYCFELADKFGEDFTAETQDILLSLLFDARRIGKEMFFSEAELNEHFYLLDIRGTIRASLKVFAENADKYKIIEPLGIASRIFYNLKDYSDDIRAGLINVPVEDMEKYNLPKGDLADKDNPRVKRWLNGQARKGLEYLEKYQNNSPAKHFRLFTGITLSAVYERPAKNYFLENLAINK